MNTSLGEDIAYEDEIIKRTLRNIKKKREYFNL